MIKFKREYRIALTIIGAILVLIMGMNFLKGKNVFDTGDVFFGIYTHIDGLTEASPIYYNGYKIGTVSEIEFQPSGKGQFLVSLSLNQEIPVTKNTVAQIYNFDLMGTKAVQFILGESNELLQPGDTLKTSVKGTMMEEVLPIKNKVEDLIVKLDTTLSNLSMVFSDDNNRSLEEGMRSFRQMMQNLEQSSGELNASLSEGGALNNSLANIDSISVELNRQRQSIGTTMENVALFSEQLKGMHLDTLAVRIDSSLMAVNALLLQAKEGEGSLGMMLSDKGLYYNMIDATANLDRLLADVRHNPKRYLSFSAIDLGRNVNVTVDDDRAEQKGIVYKVEIASSDKPLDLKNQMINEKYRIFEDTDGEKYFYTAGATSSYTEITQIRDEVKLAYPNAKVVALKDGKPVKLNKALELSGVKN